MIQLLMVGRDYGYERLRLAVETALELGCSDSAAVRYLVTADGLERVRPEAIDVGSWRATNGRSPSLPTITSS